MWPATTDRGGALRGVKVVDLTRVLAGPLCTQILSDHGADVIKVEPPTGDETRQLGPPFDQRGEAAYFGALNRGKRGLALDLSRPAGREVLERLLADADVLIENFLPGTMERWGLAYEAVLSRKYPRLVYCAVSGFGATGPLGKMPGYDAVLQAMCGLMSVNGEPSSGPTRVGVPVVDHLTGYVALTGILMALNARHHTGTGQRVEAALFDTAISLLLPHAANWMVSGNTPGLLGSAHPNIAPYDKFMAADGLVFIGILNDAQFQRFCAHIGREDLAADARFASPPQRVANRKALQTEIQRALVALPAIALCDDLMRQGVPAGPVNTVAQAIEQPHARHRQLVLERGAYKGIRSPALLHGTPAAPGNAPPRYAQHSADILGGLGFTAEEINTLRSTGAAPSDLPSKSRSN
jgi:crotonobetainyl-CoA:carnitine CoA-transferase CaiB-like acyl-CoA transferase